LIDILNTSNDAEFLKHALSDTIDIKAITDETDSEDTTDIITSMKDSN